MRYVVAWGLIVIAMLIIVLLLVGPGLGSSAGKAIAANTNIGTSLITASITVLLGGAVTYSIYIIRRRQRRRRVLKMLRVEISKSLERLKNFIPIPVGDVSFEQTGKIATFVGTGLVNSGDILLLNHKEIAKFSEVYGAIEGYNGSEERTYEYYRYRDRNAEHDEKFIKHCERHSARRKFLIQSLEQLEELLRTGEEA